MKNNTLVLSPPFPILIVICGATATGKSGLALKLAKRLSGVILSADSRQVYRDFNIGTAKPTPEEQRQVPHRLIDICDPTATLTLAEYQQQAQSLIAGLHSAALPREQEAEQAWPPEYTPEYIPEHTPEYIPEHTDNAQVPMPLLVGGTGLYIRSVVCGLRIPRVEPQPQLRSQLTALGQPLCYAFLTQVDAASADKIHPHDQVRTLRALEVYYVTGQPISTQQGEQPPSYPILQLGLDCQSSGEQQPDRLTQRIEQRTHQMMADGFVSEVEHLCQRYGSDLPLLNTLGYQAVRQYLAGQCSLEEAIALTVLHTRQFAKRQRTWFRADPTIHWFDADAADLLEQVWEIVCQFRQQHASV